MAGGIDWFRWHHGSVTDPKFALVAKKAGASLGNVIAVWAFVLESASASSERGTFGAVDVEAVDLLLGADDGTTHRILGAMSERGLIDGGVVVAWERRQVTRERAGETSTQRVRLHRERKRSETHETHETRFTDMERHVTPRGEERREEESREEERTSVRSARPTPAGEICTALKAAGVQGINPSHPRLKALIDAGATTDEFVGMADKAAGKSNGFAYLLAAVEGERKRVAETVIHTGRLPNKQELLEQSNRQIGEEWARKMLAKEANAER